MKEIKELEKHISEELHDAKKYVKCALHYKDTNKTLADLYYKLSTEEMTHMESLHKIVVSIIEEYRSKNGEPPAEMMAVYNYVHEEHIDKAKGIKILLAMYKE